MHCVREFFKSLARCFCIVAEEGGVRDDVGQIVSYEKELGWGIYGPTKINTDEACISERVKHDGLRC
jgi:hypothetical protein